MIPLYFGFDPRESIGAHVFQHSVLTRASLPVSFIPLHLDNVSKFYTETHKDGTNNFIYSRFLIPYMQGYQGWAIFMDGADMLCLNDIAKLWELRDPFGKAVQVVKHDYKTTSNRKYVGTQMESDNRDYERKNWSSVMLINCAHYAWRRVTPRFIEESSGADLHRFTFMQDIEIGELPEEWNHLVTETPANPKAKLIHYTLGIPGFKHYEHCEFSDEWFDERGRMEWASPQIKDVA
jgi:lipopolysaccharide biosynthesis glycosyltransferase